jgi:sulfate transport system substrate-binding protein
MRRGPPLARWLSGAVPALFLAGLLLFAVWPWLPVVGQGRPPRTIVFYGFSILEEVFNEAVFPAFEQRWRAETGEALDVVGSFAGSGTVTNQLIMGVPADLALLALEPDAERLARAGVVAPGSWRALPHGGVVNRTPFVVLTRPGNPKGLADFADLARPGLGIVHPDPLTSGGASWAILAEWGAAARGDPGGPEAGYQQLLGIWRNVVAQAASARGARTQFDNGFGDALITYEQEALADQATGRLAGAVVYPPRTVLSEHILVVVDKNVAADERSAVDAFVRFLWSEEAQRLFVAHGFRSVDEALNAANPAFGPLAEPFTVADLGGWPAAWREVIEATWRDRVLPELGR